MGLAALGGVHVRGKESTMKKGDGGLQAHREEGARGGIVVIDDACR